MNRISRQSRSFGLLRANPKITGNVKITIDSQNQIWLNSFDANQELSKPKYKGYRIPEGGFYATDLYKFFDDGKTPENFVFGVKGEDPIVRSYVESQNLQYDFFYASGVETLISNKYTEDYSYLAPLYINGELPSHFVIFRVPDPIDYSYKISVGPLELVRGTSYKVSESPDVNRNDPNYLPFQIIHNQTIYRDGDVFVAANGAYVIDQGAGEVFLLDPLYNYPNIQDTGAHFLEKILPKSQIVASFDLGASTEIGKYIRRIVQAPSYSESLIDFRFEDSVLSTYNGVNYKKGVMDKKGEYLFDAIRTPYTQIELERVITEGFTRNGIIGTNMLNLEFLFTDTTAKEYSINRYWGLYVNTIPTGTSKLDGAAFYLAANSSPSIGNTPVPTRDNKGYHYDTVGYQQYNENGVRIFLDPEVTSGYIPDSDDVNSYEDSKLFWCQDKTGKLHSFKRDENYLLSSPAVRPFESSYGIPGFENQVVLADTDINLGVLSGIDPTKTKQYVGSITGEKGRAHAVIRIESQLSLTPQDTIVFYHPLGSYGRLPYRYDLFKATDLSSQINGWGPGSSYVSGNVFYFHPYGTTEEIARAIAGCFNSLRGQSFDAFAIKNEVVIRAKTPGARQNQRYALDFVVDPTSLIPPFTSPSIISRAATTRKGEVFINDFDVADINSLRHFVGGSDQTENRVKVSIETANKIIPGQSWIATNKGISKVTGVFRYVDEYLFDGDTIVGLEEFETAKTVLTEDFTHRVSIGNASKILVHETYTIPFGVFSFCGLKEIDHDFWESSYGVTPTNEYLRYMSIPENGPIKVGATYFVPTGTSIRYNNVLVNGPDVFVGVAGQETYSLITRGQGNPYDVIPTVFLNNLFPPFSNPSFSNISESIYRDLDDFEGFYGLQLPPDGQNTPIVTRKGELLLQNKLNSEYDYLQENYQKEYVLASRVIPYITKWALHNGRDVRGNEYRLNNNIIFGPLNFSPSFDVREQNPAYFTHEWYLLEKSPMDLPVEDLFQRNGYCAGELDVNGIRRTDPKLDDYFMKYFTTEGEDYTAKYPNTDVAEAHVDEKYAIFKYNSSTGYSECFFRGAKIRIKRRTEESIATRTRGNFAQGFLGYDGYKFSAVLKMVEEVDGVIQSPVIYRVVENQTFKTVTLIIEVVIRDLRISDITGASPGEETALDYLALYALRDKLERGTQNFLTPPPVFADFPDISDVKLSTGLNLGIDPYLDGTFSIVQPGVGGQVNIVPNFTYETDLTDEITGVYLSGSNVSITGDFSFYGVGQGVYNLPWATGINPTSLRFGPITSSYFFDLSGPGYPPPNFTTVPYPITNAFFRNVPIYQRRGGANYWKGILERCSFAHIAEIFNTENSYINYETWSWDETIVDDVIRAGTFALEFMKPSAYVQNNFLKAVEDTIRPQGVQNQIVGYRSEFSGLSSEMVRFSGGYNPIFRDIIKFENAKSDAIIRFAPNATSVYLTVASKTPGNLYYDIGDEQTFFIDNEEQEELTLIRGNVYRFFQGDVSNLGRRAYISETPEGSNLTGGAYSRGVTYIGAPGLGSPSGYLEFRVPYDAPGVLYLVSAGDGETNRYMTVRIQLQDPLDFKYTSLGVYKREFGRIKNVNFYKYATQNIFRVQQNSGFFPLYPLIGETPIDRRDMSLFESNWDPGYFREYVASTQSNLLPGVSSVQEKKSLGISKVMKTPAIVPSYTQNLWPQSVPDVFNFNTDSILGYEVFYEETTTEIRAVILISRLILKFFNENGAPDVFEKYILPEFGFGSRTAVTDDFESYINTNIINTYEAKSLKSFVKRIPLSQTQNLAPVVTNLLDHQKLIQGYYPTSASRFVRKTDYVYEYTLVKDPGYDYSVAFSIEIGKI